MACSTEIDEKKYLRLIPAVLKTHFLKWSCMWEDMAQEAFFGLRYGVQSFNPEKVRADKTIDVAFENYVYECIKNRLKRFLTATFRSPAKQDYLLFNDDRTSTAAYRHTSSDEMVDIDPVNELHLFNELDIMLKNSNIPDKHKLVLSQRFRGKTYAEIGEALGCTRQNIERLYVSAIRSLKAQKNIFFDL